MSQTTAPKPFIFVLMPFSKEFADIYKFGIKGAAEDAGAYAERLDEQVFREGMLDRIFNQINKADVIVADMTGRNENVFYEVGYAHALNKTVLLLTQNSDDIPFDLKHRQHIIYNGEIAKLRDELGKKIVWAIQESKSNKLAISGPNCSVSLAQKLLTTGTAAIRKIDISRIKRHFGIKMAIENNSDINLNPINYVYLLTDTDAKILPRKEMGLVGRAFEADPFRFCASPAKNNIKASGNRLLNQYRLNIQLPLIPPMAVETRTINLVAAKEDIDERNYMVLRIHCDTQVFDYPFSLKVNFEEDE